MDLTNYFKRVFEVEYDRINKILTINKPMRVADFVYLKKIIPYLRDEVKDIRLYGDRRTRVESKI